MLSRASKKAQPMVKTKMSLKCGGTVPRRVIGLKPSRVGALRWRVYIRMSRMLV